MYPGDRKLSGPKTQNQSVRSLGNYTESIQRGIETGGVRSPDNACITIKDILKSPELS